MKVIKNNILVIIMILMVLISIAVYDILPTRLPIHFTLTGTVDGTAPKLGGYQFYAGYGINLVADKQFWD